MNQQLVLDAVRNESASSKQGILQKLFAIWFDAFVYNQIWEDPRVDLQALEIDSNSRILTISSGGCNALNYLVEKPQSVTAVDLNRHHIFLLNLKIAALKYLPSYEDFFCFFGYGKTPDALRLYNEFIAPNLDSETRLFWETNSLTGSFVYGSRIRIFERGGLYEHSRNGYFLRFFHGVSALFGCRPEEILKAESLIEQERLYEQYIEPFFDSALIKMIGRLPVTTFGLGIPPQQYEELRKGLAEGKTVVDTYRERVKLLACRHTVGDNYFAWQAFARKYDTENRVAIPEYLKMENYERLKASANKLTTWVGSATAAIRDSPKNAFNRFVFLDAQDWMNTEAMTELWSAVAEQGDPDSRIIFRTAGEHSPIERILPPYLRRKFRYEKDRSDALFKLERASIYGGFHLYRSESKL